MQLSRRYVVNSCTCLVTILSLFPLTLLATVQHFILVDCDIIIYNSLFAVVLSQLLSLALFNKYNF